MDREATAGKRSNNLPWVFTTNFAEGFPYAIVHSIIEALFTSLGFSLQSIGNTSLFHLPWNLKFLWAPFVEAYGSKRAWILFTEGLLLIAILALAGLIAASKLTEAAVIGTIITFFIIAFLSATHDIAIDGYYLEALNEKSQARWVGIRTTAYRVALLLVGGPGLVWAGRYGYPSLMVLCALGMGLLLLIHSRLLKAFQAERPLVGLLKEILWSRGFVLFAAAALLICLPFASGAIELKSSFVTKLGGYVSVVLFLLLSGGVIFVKTIRTVLERFQNQYAKSFLAFLEKPKVTVILAFILFFRAGESLLEKIRLPFFNYSFGLTVEQYGYAKTLGIFATLASTVLGGALISKHSLRTWIWPLVLAQNLLNLLYVWVALLPEPSVFLMSSVIITEMFGAGLGTAVFMVYLMRCPLPGHRAAHFAILTALMSVGFTLLGPIAGFLADRLGYPMYFALTFVVSVPGMALIPFLPHLSEKPADAASG